MAETTTPREARAGLVAADRAIPEQRAGPEQTDLVAAVAAREAERLGATAARAAAASWLSNINGRSNTAGNGGK